MQTKAPTFRQPIANLLLIGALAGSTWHYFPGLLNHPIGLGVLIVCGLVWLGSIWDIFDAGNHTATQIRLGTQARQPSGEYGRSRLAAKRDTAIQALRDRTGFFLGALDGMPLFYDPFARGNGHMLTYAPSRTGKTISVVISALLHWARGSIFVTDVKGEIAAITAHFRMKWLKQSIGILNPFGVLGLPALSCNLLQPLLDDIEQNNGVNLHDFATLVGLQHIPDSGHGDGAFFANGGRRLLIALLLYLAVFIPTECHLPKLRQLVWSTDEEKRKIARHMQECNWFGGLMKEYGNALADMLDPSYVKTYGAFRDHAMAAVQIYDAHTSFGQSLIKSDFQLSDILDGKTTLYAILPENKLETHGAWLGLLTTMLFETIAASPKPSRVMFLLEEMGNLGRLPNLEKALSLLPGKGCRCWMIFQSRRQPVQLYGQNVAQLIEEQSSMLQSWSIRSLADQKDWSARIGTTTRKSHSLSHDPVDKDTPWRLSVSERPAAVLQPEEIGRLPRDRQLIHIDGLPVICAQKVPYFGVHPWRYQAAPSPHHPNGFPKNEPIVVRLK
ncbi:MAG: type IV secretory system conjugative DNA transfer family protein [Rhodospirillales bacterium]|nr:type IV secretory system conjugative DNA transfer family protein [Rhodospirillales bacterium]